MHKDLHHEQRRDVVLSASVLEVLKDLPAGALKVFLYLSSRNQGQPFAASIPTIAAGTGKQRRSVISALNTLRERQLITRISGSGNRPNRYGIPKPNREDADAPKTNDSTDPSPGLTQAKPPVATPTQTTTPAHTTALQRAKSGQPAATSPIPTQTTTPVHTTALQSAKSGQLAATSPTPTPATIPELVATCYRPMSAPGICSTQTGVPGRTCPPRNVGDVRA